MSGPGRGPGPRGPMAGGAPGQKAQNFGPSAKRLLGTLRVDSATKTATVEGPARLHYMDALTVVVSGLVAGAPASLLFAVVDSERNALATAVSGSAWAAVPNAPGKVYAKYSLDTAAAPPQPRKIAPHAFSGSLSAA